MKRSFIYSVFILLGSFVCYGQSTRPKNNEISNSFLDSKSTIIKISPFNILWGSVPTTSELSLKAEMRISPYQTLTIGASFIGKTVLIPLLDSTTQKNLEEYSYLGYRVQAEYRFYLSRLNKNLFPLSKYEYAPLGFYIGPNISYAQMTINFKPTPSALNYVQCTQFYTTLNAGVQFDLLDMVIVDLFIGMGFQNNEWLEYRNGKTKPLLISTERKLYNTNQKRFIGFAIGYPLK